MKGGPKPSKAIQASNWCIRSGGNQTSRPSQASHRLWQARQSGLRLWCLEANGWGGVHRDLHASQARQLIDFLQHVEEWIPKDVERVYAVLDNLSMHPAMDGLFFNPAIPR